MMRTARLPAAGAEQFPTGDESSEDDVGELRLGAHEPAELRGRDRQQPSGLGNASGEEEPLARQQVQLAQEPARSMGHDDRLAHEPMADPGTEPGAPLYDPGYGPLVQTRVRVATWNLWGRYGPWEARMPVITENLRAIDADILGLTEVWEDDTRSQADELAAALGYTEPVYAPNLERDGARSGNAVLSRWPITRHEVRVLPRRGAFDAVDEEGEERLCLFAEVDGPRGPIQIFCAHLSWSADHSAVRQEQTREIARFLTETRPAPVSGRLVRGSQLRAVQRRAAPAHGPRRIAGAACRAARRVGGRGQPRPGLHVVERQSVRGREPRSRAPPRPRDGRPAEARRRGSRARGTRRR